MAREPQRHMETEAAYRARTGRPVDRFSHRDGSRECRPVDPEPVRAEEREGAARARLEVPEWLQMEVDAHHRERRAERRMRFAITFVVLVGGMALAAALSRLFG